MSITPIDESTITGLFDYTNSTTKTPSSEASNFAESLRTAATGQSIPSQITVKSGDTLSQIAVNYGLKTSDIATENNISNSNLIYPNQVINLTKASTNSQTTPTNTASTNNISTSSTVSTNSNTTDESDAETSARTWIAAHESSGSYTATNGKYYGKYQLDISYLKGDLSAANQERTANTYVTNRYGSWVKAKEHWLKYNWY